VDDVRRALGRRVRGLRAAHKLSQEQLAERCSLHRTHISGIERGRFNLTLNTLTRLAKGLGMPLSELFAGVGPLRSKFYSRQ
jgi:transcriptional regulator with XRE-family HTH domain